MYQVSHSHPNSQSLYVFDFSFRGDVLFCFLVVVRNRSQRHDQRLIKSGYRHCLISSPAKISSFSRFSTKTQYETVLQKKTLQYFGSAWHIEKVFISSRQQPWKGVQGKSIIRKPFNPITSANFLHLVQIQVYVFTSPLLASQLILSFIHQSRLSLLFPQAEGHQCNLVQYLMWLQNHD